MPRKPRKPTDAHTKAAVARAVARAEGKPITYPKDRPEFSAEPEPKAGRMPTRRKAKEETAREWTERRFTLKVGRPSDYRPEMCDQVIDMGAKGYSKAQMAAELGCDRGTVDEWAKAYPEFSRSIKRAATLSLAWWEHKGMWGMDRGIGFNATSWLFSMKNRFREDYSDKTDHHHSGQIDFNAIRDALDKKGVKS